MVYWAIYVCNSWLFSKYYSNLLLILLICVFIRMSQICRSILMKKHQHWCAAVIRCNRMSWYWHRRTWIILVWLRLASTAVSFMKQQRLWRPLNVDVAFKWYSFVLGLNYPTQLILHGYSCRRQCVCCHISVTEYHPRALNWCQICVFRKQFKSLGCMSAWWVSMSLTDLTVSLCFRNDYAH